MISDMVPKSTANLRGADGAARQGGAAAHARRKEEAATRWTRAHAHVSRSMVMQMTSEVDVTVEVRLQPRMSATSPNESPREQRSTRTVCSAWPLRVCHCVTLTVPSMIM